jgi:hypothetical protein
MTRAKSPFAAPGRIVPFRSARSVFRAVVGFGIGEPQEELLIWIVLVQGGVARRPAVTGRS